MGRTLTLEEAKDRTALDLIREAIDRHEPLIITLEDGTAVSIQQYQPTEHPQEEPLTPEMLTLEPLPKLQGNVPANWKELAYGEDGTGTP